MDPVPYRTHIKSGQSWVRIPWVDVWEYRDLLWMLVKRDLTAIYKQSILGPAWFVLQPLAMTVVFTIIFGNIAKISTEGTPPFLFYLSATVLWNYFAGCLNGVANALIINAAMLSKVYFPRLIIPLSIVLSNLAQFILSFLMFLGVYLYFLIRGAPIQPTPWIAALPLFVLQAAVVGLGVGLWLSAATVKYRDLRFALPFLSQLWMYMTPVVYSASLVPDKWRWFLYVNPMAALTELNRYAFMGVGSLSAGWVIGSLAMGVMLLVTGLLAFNKVQRTFVDTI